MGYTPTLSQAKDDLKLIMQRKHDFKYSGEGSVRRAAYDIYRIKFENGDISCSREDYYGGTFHVIRSKQRSSASRYNGVAGNSDGFLYVATDISYRVVKRPSILEPAPRKMKGSPLFAYYQWAMSQDILPSDGEMAKRLNIQKGHATQCRKRLVLTYKFQLVPLQKPDATSPKQAPLALVAESGEVAPASAPDMSISEMLNNAINHMADVLRQEFAHQNICIGERLDKLIEIWGR